MVRIRLSRNGTKKRPFYQIVVTDNRNSRDGRFIEKIGFFNPIPINKKKEFYLNLNRVTYWINTGATVSNRVLKLIKQSRNKTNI